MNAFTYSDTRELDKKKSTCILNQVSDVIWTIPKTTLIIQFLKPYIFPLMWDFFSPAGFFPTYVGLMPAYAGLSFLVCVGFLLGPNLDY